MATITVRDLINRAAYHSAESVGPNTRHTPEMMVDLVNESLKRYHALKNQAGHPPDIKRTTVTTSSDATVTLGWPLNSYVALPTDFLTLTGASLQLTGAGAGWVQLNPFSEIEKALVWDPWGLQTGQPATYALAKDTDGGDIMRLLPAADAAYTIEVIYVPKFTELAMEDEYEFLDGTEAFVACDIAMQMLESVDLANSAQYAKLELRKQSAASAIKTYSWSRARAGVQNQMNTRGAERVQTRRARYYRGA